jgi:hypothetical protein
MSFLELMRLVLRHKLAVAVVVICSIAVVGDIKYARHSFGESATVVFEAPTSVANPNPYTTFVSSLLSTGDVVTRILNSPQLAQRIRNEGGSAQYAVGLVNLYNLEYPDYGQPYATVSTVSESPVTTHSTFMIVSKELVRVLADAQAKSGVPAHDQITAHIVGDTGPIVLAGSTKRAYGGLLLLTVIAVIMVAAGLDRWRVRRGKTPGPRRGRRRALAWIPGRLGPAHPRT